MMFHVLHASLASQLCVCVCVCSHQVVKFHPNGNYVATGSCDKSVRLWDVVNGNCVRIFTGHKASTHALAFSPDGKLLASAGRHTHYVCSVAFSVATYVYLLIASVFLSAHMLQGGS